MPQSQSQNPIAEFNEKAFRSLATFRRAAALARCEIAEIRARTRNALSESRALVSVAGAVMPYSETFAARHSIIAAASTTRANNDTSLVEWVSVREARYLAEKIVNRQHLDASQRAMVAARIATLRRGANQHSPIGETTQADAAELLNVGKRSIERARAVLEHGQPELQRAVDEGRVSVSAAADLTELPKPQQAEIVARGEKEMLAAAKKIREDKIKKGTQARTG
jgi:hypothetical protein